MELKEVISELENKRNSKNIEGMKGFGIKADNAFGLRAGEIASLAKQIGKDHNLAEELWDTGYREARLLTAIIADINRVPPALADKWVSGIDSWDICDSLLGKLLWKAPFAYEKAAEWQVDRREFVRRSGFVMMCSLAVHDKKAPDEKFVHFYEFIIDKSTDERNFVKKAVNWALRQLGKRSMYLNQLSLHAAEQILLTLTNSRSARWIAKDAIRELASEAVQLRLSKKQSNLQSWQ